jgi:hypothetical protein
MKRGGPCRPRSIPSADTQGWVVEAPASGNLASGDFQTFRGSAVLLQAPEYTHHTYGSASYFCR